MPGTLIVPTISSERAIDDDDVHAVADVQELLHGIVRQRQVARELRVGLDQLFHERAVRRERLNAPVLAIGDIDHAVVGDAQRMDDAEVRRTRDRPGSVFGVTTSQWSSSTGLLPKAPHMRLNAPVSASKTMTR